MKFKTHRGLAFYKRGLNDASKVRKTFNTALSLSKDDDPENPSARDSLGNMGFGPPLGDGLRPYCPKSSHSAQDKAFGSGETSF